MRAQQQFGEPELRSQHSHDALWESRMGHPISQGTVGPVPGQMSSGRLYCGYLGPEQPPSGSFPSVGIKVSGPTPGPRSLPASLWVYPHLPSSFTLSRACVWLWSLEEQRPSGDREQRIWAERDRAQQAQEVARKTHTQDSILQLPPEPALQFSAPATPTPDSRPQFMPQPASQLPCSLYPNLFHSLYLSSHTAYTPTYAIACIPGPTHSTLYEASPAPLPESTIHTGFHPQWCHLQVCRAHFIAFLTPASKARCNWAWSLCSEQGQEFVFMPR